MTRLIIAGIAVWILTASAAVPGAAQQPHARQSKGIESLFSPSTDCVACHNSLVTSEGENVSIGTMWRSTMMANAARDPYFHAGVRREITDHPSLASEIQDECAACHMPMLQRMAHAAGGRADILAQLPIAAAKSTTTHQLAADGVSCTVCHQVTGEKLGTRESFNGRFVMAPTPVDGVRRMFGPYNIDQGRTTVMRSATGFAQSEATHVQESAVCATCHTLYTDAFGADGRRIGGLPEQMNFQEWQHSDYSEEGRGCQSCHMPEVTTPTRVASVLGEQRERMSRHLFVGGNFVVLGMFNRHRSELGVAALPSELEATASATRRQLSEQTASIAVERATVTGGGLAFDVSIQNLVGHKLPTGYPSRRAWLHVTVTTAAGAVLFESGALMPTGAIVGNDNDADANAYEPHYAEISRPDQVQIYEAVMAGVDGRITTGLLTATQYAKDNRLLPRGFDKRTADPDIAVHGGATNDPDFTGGTDRVRYLIPITAAGRLRVDVELRYQPIGFRWVENLRGYDAPEPRRFTGYFSEAADTSSVIVARATLQTP